MKGCKKSTYEDPRFTPAIPEGAIEFCLGRLYADKKHDDGEEIVKGLTFEEVIGALVLAKLHVKRHKADLAMNERLNNRIINENLRLKAALDKATRRTR